MKKVLIVTYYWPPCGGAGIQRWLKFAKYLPEYGWEPIVLTVDPEYGSYQVFDTSLEKEVAELNIEVHRTRSREVLNYFSKLFGKKSLPQGGVSQKKSFKTKVMMFIRGNMFVPDPRKGWNRFAYRKAMELIREYDIKKVITTSPPHSTQLIGYKLKKNANIEWISDFRDPWTMIYTYEELNQLPFIRTYEKSLEKKVIVNADKMITVGPSLKSSLESIRGKQDVHVITNGYDHEISKPAASTPKKASDPLRIIYTGTMNDQYDPFVFFEALKLALAESDLKIEVDFFGGVGGMTRSKVREMGFSEDTVRFNNTISYHDSLAEMRKSDILFMVIPKAKSEKEILTGKIFEYLATKLPILCIGPKDGDAAQIINETDSGKVFERNEVRELADWIKASSTHEFSFKNTEKYSRTELTRVLADVLNS